RGALRRFAALIGILTPRILNVVEPLEAAAAVSSRWLLWWGWWRLSWRWRGGRRGGVGIHRCRRGGLLRAFPRHGIDDLVDGGRLFVFIVECGLRIVRRNRLRLFDLDQPIGDAALGGDRKVRCP